MISEVEFLEIPIKNENEILGWEVHIEDPITKVLSGGSSSSIDIARKIALCEYKERTEVAKLSKSDGGTLKSFALDRFNSTCGFACGFDSRKTRLRSLCEGLERWAIANWIDRELFIPQIKEDSEGFGQISPIAQHYLRSFIKSHFFRKTFSLSFSNGLAQSAFPCVVDIHVSIFLGETEKGVFVGSRANLLKENIWEHEIVEAFRNLENFSRSEKGLLEVDSSNIYANRVLFFGRNKKVAFSQIASCKKKDWPSPQILVHKEVPLPESGFFVWRTLFADYIHWCEGPSDRFVL